MAYLTLFVVWYPIVSGDITDLETRGEIKMSCNRRGRLVCKVLLAVPILAASGLAAQTGPAPVPAITFAAQAATVQGITPGGQVVWFAAIRDTQEYAVLRSTVAQIAVADATGRSILALPSPVAPFSIWVAVDYKTGAFAIATPSPSFPVQAASLDPAALSVGAGAGPDYLRDAADRLQVLLVRPG